MELSKNLIQSDVDPIDLFILNKLHDRMYGWNERNEKGELTTEEIEKFRNRKSSSREPASITTLDSMIKKELGINISRPQVEERIERLKAKNILISEHSIVVNPSKLFDHVAHVYLKLAISDPFKRSIDWWEAIKEIWTLDKTPGSENETATDIVRLIGIIEGTGEYDVVLLVFTNDMDNISRLLKKLSEKNYIQKSMTQRLWAPTGAMYDPVIVPDYYKYTSLLSQYGQRIQAYREKIKKD